MEIALKWLSEMFAQQPPDNHIKGEVVDLAMRWNPLQKVKVDWH